MENGEIVAVMLTNQPLAPSLKLRFYPEPTLRKGLVHSPFKLLSRDLIRTIFCYLRDVKSVKHVRKACRLFYVDSETRLVVLLARNLKLPIKIDSLLDDFRPVIKLKVLLNQFIGKYIVLDHILNEVTFLDRDKSACLEEYEKITWHVRIHQDSEQPLIKEYLVVLEHQTADLTFKLALIMLLHLPKGHCLFGIKQEEGGGRFPLRLLSDGRPISPPESQIFKDCRKIWSVLYDSDLQELELLINNLRSDLVELRKALDKF